MIMHQVCETAFTSIAGVITLLWLEERARGWARWFPVDLRARLTALDLVLLAGAWCGWRQLLAALVG